MNLLRFCFLSLFHPIISFWSFFTTQFSHIYAPRPLLARKIASRKPLFVKYGTCAYTDTSRLVFFIHLFDAATQFGRKYVLCAIFECFVGSGNPYFIVGKYFGVILCIQ